MDFQPIADHFGITGVIAHAEEIHSGNINRTYLVAVQEANTQKEYVFQRINTFVFKKPEEVMDNILKVTEHIKKKLLATHGCYDRRVLSFLVGVDGKPYYYAAGNRHFWRVYEYIDRAVAYDQVVKPELFYEAGRSFGEFQGWLSDFPAQTLAEIIPNFHNTPARFEAFRRSVEADTVGRRIQVEDEIRFLLDREAECGVLTEKLASGEIPYRVTHNDTKINNILFDNHTDKAMCVIDLDTVMPGTALYDFGDAVRYGASTALEDERDLSKVSIDLHLYEQFTKGFLESMGDSLTAAEIALLPHSVKIMALELASRFLTDYLDGDVYFKTRSDDHNLVRARTQIRLVRDIEAKWTELRAITARYC
ncbi:MAG: aminoglycoside phosphotransferase family protein [Clostridia bacterium]|nr:aminoglycoside phosphotransferase family protein [Clostridia bacterium]